jgi:hypothetical protein
MQYCSRCKVHIRGNKSICPLCGNVLPKASDGGVHEEVFPEIPPSYEAHLAIRIMVFISISVIVISFALHLMFHINIDWPIFVILGLGSMWLSLTLVIRKRHNITKNIMWQVTIVSLLSIIWDWKIGWMGWSITYVIPVSYVVAMFVMYVTAKIMKLGIHDYILYFFLDGLFGIIPILFMLLGWAKVFYPSIICVAVSIIFLSAIFIFQGDNIKMELARKMHI